MKKVVLPAALLGLVSLAMFFVIRNALPPLPELVGYVKDSNPYSSDASCSVAVKVRNATSHDYGDVVLRFYARNREGVVINDWEYPFFLPPNSEDEGRLVFIDSRCSAIETVTLEKMRPAPRKK